MIEEVRADDLSAFEHRKDYAETRGRDRWTVRVVNAWVSAAVPPLLASGTGAVLDVGCGEQPFRPLVEASAAFAGLRRLIAPGCVAVLTIPFIVPLHMEPYDYRRLTLHGIEPLARCHKFRFEQAVRLGGLPDVLGAV